MTRQTYEYTRYVSTDAIMSITTVKEYDSNLRRKLSDVLVIVPLLVLLPLLDVSFPFLYEFRYITGLHWCCECYYERSCMRALLSFMVADFLVPAVVNVRLLFQALETRFIRAKCERWLKRKYQERLIGILLVAEGKNHQLWFLCSKADKKSRQEEPSDL